MKTNYLLAISIAIFSSLLSLRAQSDVVVAKVRYHSTGYCNSDTTMTLLTYHIRPDILRLDFKGPKANSSMIFQPSSQKVWVIYWHEKSYYSMSKDDIEQFDRQVKGAATELELQKQNMSEEHKRNSMDPWGGNNPLLTQDLNYIYIKKRDSLISQLICKRYEATTAQGQKKIAFLNDFKTMGIKDDQLAILSEFYEFMGTGTRILAGSLDLTSFRKWDEGGYPVLVELGSSKSPCNTLWMTSISKEKIKDDFFKVPYSFSKMDNPVGRSPEEQD